ncbi:MAG: IS256 family transposase [Deltaproteobacteria bacterium]|nr:MAG: IS256 family transposase [Deltaproteobacteria bacterium]
MKDSKKLNPETIDKPIIMQINEDQVRSHLDGLVKDTVEDTLNQMLDAEAEELLAAKRYEHTDDRLGTRAGHYDRQLMTKAGKVNLKMPKLRGVKFETAIIEQYRRREISVEEALMQMYLAGVSVRRVEDITQALWGERVSPSSISDLNQKMYVTIEEWRNRPIEGEFPYVFLDGIWLKRNWGGTCENIAVLVAVGVNQDGHREILGVQEGMKEDADSWSSFLRHLKERGLKGVRLVVSDKSLGLVNSLPLFFVDAAWQRCTTHFYRNVFKVTPNSKVGEVANMLKAIHAQEDREAALEKIESVVQKLEGKKLGKAADCVREGAHETLSYYDYPSKHWRHLRTNNMLERVMREIRRRTRVVGNFPDGKSALMLVAARLRYVGSKKWSTRRYMNMDHLYDLEKEKEQLALHNEEDAKDSPLVG